MDAVCCFGHVRVPWTAQRPSSVRENRSAPHRKSRPSRQCVVTLPLAEQRAAGSAEGRVRHTARGVLYHRRPWASSAWRPAYHNYLGKVIRCARPLHTPGNSANSGIEPQCAMEQYRRLIPRTRLAAAPPIRASVPRYTGQPCADRIRATLLATGPRETIKPATL